MAYLYRCYACCFLYFISQVSYGLVDTSLFPGANTVPTSNGNTARLAGVTSINKTGRNANLVLDLRNKYGNPIRVFKTAKFNPLKLKSYITTCVRNPIACGASAALTSALLYYGYTLNSDGVIVLPGAAGSYSECVEKPHPWNDEGGVVTANGPIPCAVGPNYAGKYILYTFEPLPQYPDLPPNGDLPQGVVRLSGYVYSPSLGEYAETKVHYQNWYDLAPVQPALEQEISADQATEIALASPELLQIEAGAYPDVFEPVEVAETATDGDFSDTPVDPDPTDTDSPEPTEPMIGMDYIEEETVDLSEYFDFGVGWLPKTCPADKDLLTIGDKTFTFEYGILCSLLADYASPFIRFGAVLSFIAIIFGGVRNE